MVKNALTAINGQILKFVGAAPTKIITDLRNIILYQWDANVGFAERCLLMHVWRNALRQISHVQFSVMGACIKNFMSEEVTSRLTPKTPRGEEENKMEITGNLGRIAYEAYCGHTQWRSLVSGAPLPRWQEATPEIQAAWEAAGKAVDREVCLLSVEAAKLFVQLAFKRKGDEPTPKCGE